MKEERKPFTHVAIGCASLQALLDDKASLEAALTRVQERCTEQEQTIRDMKAPKEGKRPYTKPAMEELTLTKGVCVSETRERNLQRDLTRKTRELERVTGLVSKQQETIERVRENLFDVAKERDQLKAMLQARREENALLGEELSKAKEDKGCTAKTVSGEPQDFDEELRADLATVLYSNKAIATSLIQQEDVESLIVWARKMIEKEAELINENAQLQELSTKVREELVAARDALSKGEGTDTYSEENRRLREERISHLSAISTLRAQVQEYKEAEADGPACDKCGSHREKHDVVCIPCLNKEREDYESELAKVREQLGKQEEVECDQCGVVFPVFAEADEDSVVLCSSCGPKQTDQIAALQARMEELEDSIKQLVEEKRLLVAQSKQLEGDLAKVREEHDELRAENRSLTASKIASDQAHTQRFISAQHAKEEAVFERDLAQADRDTLITQYDRKCEELVAAQKERDGAIRKLRGVYEAVRKVAPEEPLPEWAKADDETS